jgi:hypothetical protein
VNKLIEAVNYEFYKEKLTEDEFNTILEMDPTSDKKYARWLITLYLKETIPEKYENGNVHWYMNNIINLKSKIAAFDSWKKNKIIPIEDSDVLRRFKTLKEFALYYARNHEKYDEMLTEKEAEKNGNNIKVLFNDKKHILLMPLDYDASYKWGIKYSSMNKDGHTGWCTTSTNQYSNYADKGDLYINRRYLEDGKTLDPHWGSQLWIPTKGGKGENVQCKNVEDDDVEYLDDTIFKGIPRDVKNEIEELIEDAGGYNNKKYYSLDAYMRIEPIENDKAPDNGVYDFDIDIFISLQITTEDGDSDQENLNEAGSIIHIKHMGKSFPLGDLLKPNYLDREINFKKHNGLFISVKDRTPDEAYSNAWKEWSHFDPDTDQMMYMMEQSDDFYTQLCKENDGNLLSTINNSSYMVIDENLPSDDFFDSIMDYFKKASYDEDTDLYVHLPAGYELWVKKGINLHFGSGEEVDDFEKFPGQIKFPWG